MGKEEILKVQKFVLKVNIHCNGCKQKVRKILNKIDGVYTIDIDAEQGKVMVSGNCDPNILIKKLHKAGKFAKLLDIPPPMANDSNNQQNDIVNQMKNVQIANGKGAEGNNKGQRKDGNNQPKGVQQGQNPQQLQQEQMLQQQQLQQLQQLQQMKEFQDLKGVPPQLKDMKMPSQNPNNPKEVNLNSPEDDDDGFYEEEESDEEFEEEASDGDNVEDPEHPLNKMKLPVMNKNYPQLVMNAPQKAGPGNGGGDSGNGGGNGKKGGPLPVQMQGMGGGYEGNKRSGNKHIPGGGNININGKNGGGIPVAEAKIGNMNGAGDDGGIPPNNGGMKDAEKSGGVHAMNNGFTNMGVANVHPVGGANMKMPMGGAMGNNPMNQMGNMSMPMNQMGNMPPMNHMANIPVVQGLPTAMANGGGGGYYQGGALEMMPGNPYNQQGQSYMYARLHPVNVNYLYPPPYSYPPPELYYSNYFNDENTSSCSVM